MWKTEGKQQPKRLSCPKQQPKRLSRPPALNCFPPPLLPLFTTQFPFWASSSKICNLDFSFCVSTPHPRLQNSSLTYPHPHRTASLTLDTSRSCLSHTVGAIWGSLFGPFPMWVNKDIKASKLFLLRKSDYRLWKRNLNLSETKPPTRVMRA